MDDNILLFTDSYKITHHRQYPPGTKYVTSYFESRGGKYDELVFFGLQYIIKKWLIGSVVTMEKIKEAKEICKDHFGSDVFNEDGWKYIVEFHKGKLPIEIKAVDEGTIVPVKNVLFTVENTDPECFWLVNYFETLLVQCWYPITVATKSYHMKKTIHKYLTLTSNEGISDIDFRLHDFGCRGASSFESSSIGGCAHLINFQGTDTLPAISLAKKFYDCRIAGFSIPAAEHSTITSWGKNHEIEAYRNMCQVFPNLTVAIVSDSYDIFYSVENYWCKELKDLLDKRCEKGLRTVIRPDSGDAKNVLIGMLQILEKHFKITINELGYKVLPNHIRIIQGDGVNESSLNDILCYITGQGWSAENLYFGCGGGLLQKMNRDTLKFAYKCSSININGVECGDNINTTPPF
ncbi:Pre-B cell-enhancing factor [Intoshia linei]|uniref:Nicotinamide phosphoribosyltransferase n=1 Tax=Intoshia linei TaxID=1819745 RepID=A0A177AZE5_9BILA|nr:Pre-B cell-enhancing factor [Intoshia linei]